MSDYKKQYKQKKIEVTPDYLSSIKRISEINSETSNKKDEYGIFLHSLSSWILKLCKLEEELRNENYFTEKSFDELYQINKDLFSDIQPGNYDNSYVNPDFAVKTFGEKNGQLLTYFSTFYKLYPEFAYDHITPEILKFNNLFIELSEALSKPNFTYDELKNIVISAERKDKTDDYTFKLNQDYNPDMCFLNSIFSDIDLKDLRYIFKYGKHITDNEIKNAKHLSEFPEEKIKDQARSIVKAYIRGFELEQKDLSNKKTVNYIGNIGMERLSVEVIKELKKNNLDALLSNIQTTPANKQYRYDHRFDIALYLTEEYTANSIKAYENALENTKTLLSGYSGIIMFDKFGEKPFSPVNKDSIIKLSPEQRKIFGDYTTNFRASMDRFMRSDETSFTAVSLPSPEIGDDYEKIFDGIMDVNMMDTDHQEKIQKNIIDVLDAGEYVEVKGKDKNETHIKVNLHTLKNPDKETNFLNIGADKNIPVGEVFTSPKLEGTNGLIHFEEVFLKGIKFENLKFTFKDGYISDFSCTNFDTEEENKKFIQENLLFPHKTLPMGEFAIGTNTTAYKLAKKYNIVNILPILIVEKMGPHFAIGDTCFMWQEDHKIYNVIDRKEMIAKDNERSILRKEDLMKAYTNIHTDMTLPYESIEYIASVRKDGSKDYIIKDGIFAVKGTEELNHALLNQ